jgi:ABC-type uncharacterized transport system involved in gliding motility auxiliary subunit
VGVASRGLRGEVLARTSEQSGRLTGQFMYDPLERYTQEMFTEKEIPLAALVEGAFTSAFNGKPAPVDTAADALPPTSSPVTTGPATRIVVMGDGDFVRDQFGNRENLTFFANMVDYLVDEACLITIRSKELAMPPLDPVSDGTKKAVKYANLVLPPALVLGYGLLRWRMRKARKRALETR